MSWKLLEGEWFNPQYKLNRLLGEGTFGGVFVADEVVLDRCLRQVALKVISINDDQSDRQLAELQTAINLKHPHLLNCHTSVVGEVKEMKFLGLVMELAEESLQDRFHKETLSATETRELAIALAKGLDYLHQNNIVHRDIKPANILRVGDTWKIADFGIARFLDDNKTMTQTSQPIGTRAYMPPESYQGEIRPAWDWWSCGVVLAEALTGFHPFPATTEQQLMMKIMNEEPQLAQGISESFATVIRGCLIKDVASRWKAKPILGKLEEKRGQNPSTPPSSDSKDSSQTSSGNDSGEFSSQLQTFTFETVRIKTQKRGWLFPSFDVITQRQRGEAQQEVIDLGKGIKLEMVAIPGGSFMMGAPGTEEGSQDSERPQHRVEIAPFYMGRYPITQAQYEAMMGENPSRFSGANNPVEEVSWHEAKEFCKRLSEKTGREYRLPSEAEWEYACRAGTTTPFYFGETITSELANYPGTSTYGNEPEGVYRKKTTPVGSFPPNAFGLYDLHGNVLEWCEDVWHDNYQGAPADGSAWVAGGNHDRRVLRGGSWHYHPGFCRCANRVRSYPDYGSSNDGFRVVSSVARTL